MSPERETGSRRESFTRGEKIFVGIVGGLALLAVGFEAPPELIGGEIGQYAAIIAGAILFFAVGVATYLNRPPEQ